MYTAKWQHDKDALIQQREFIPADKTSSDHPRVAMQIAIDNVASREGGWAEILDNAGGVLYAHPDSRAKLHGIKPL